MKRKIPYKNIILFVLFFLFQWSGQFAAAHASQGNNVSYLILYFCFISRGFIWIIIIKEMKLSFAYSLSSLTYLFIPLLSFIILDESFKANYIPGGLMILSGIVLIGMAEQKKKSPL